MAIDVETESLLSLTEATKVLPRINGRKPAISTLWRWCRRGLRGVKLEYLRYGRNIVTTRQALTRFFTALAEVDAELEMAVPVRPASLGKRGITSNARLRSLKEADDILARAGA
ncbi:MAG: DUF1580 domain-containing protein [Phycisphaerae bacterium]